MNFSVVIPCRNSASWIRESLNSVFEQTHAAFEVIVVDDGSEDSSVEVIQSFGDRVQLLHSECRNGAGTRNIGISKASGDWIAFLDADDVWYPNHLERAWQLLDTTDDVGFLNWYDHFSDESPKNRHSRPNLLSIIRPSSGISALEFLENYQRTGWFNMHGCVVNRKRLLEVGMLDENQIRRHDIDMWLRVIEGHTWSYDPVPSSAYRRDTPGSISSQLADAAYYAFRAIEKNQRVIPEPIFRHLIHKRSLSALAEAFHSGNSVEQRRASNECDKYLRPHERVLLAVFAACPSLAKKTISIHRSRSQRKA